MNRNLIRRLIVLGWYADARYCHWHAPWTERWARAAGVEG